MSRELQLEPDAPGEELSLVGVAHHYLTDAGDTVHALDATDLEIPAGQFVCLVGPSGCGKTTLLRILAGFICPSEGTVTVGGRPLEGPSASRGVVFQQSTLYPWFTVRGNVELGPRYRGVPRHQRAEEADRYLAMVGLSEAADLRPYELSGGMQQRCQIARALANRPSIILMDEPFGALDALTRQRLQADMAAVHRKQACTVFFITHSVDEAVFLGDRVLVMSPRPGRIVFDKPVELADRAALGAEVRSTPDFIALRDRVSAAIEL